MKKSMPILVLMIVSAMVLAAGADCRAHCRHDGDRTFRDKSIDLEDGTLKIEHDDEGWIVEITEDYELYVNGERVKTDRHEKKLLRRYYRDYEKIEDMAGELGREASKIGRAGVKAGAIAVACVARLVIDGFDDDDIDIDIDIDTEAIEKMAEKLEKKAEKIEDLADDLEKTHRKLRKSIPELGELEDF
jgi:hypothetical protein